MIGPMRRLPWLILPLTFFFIVALASALLPDPSGIGTHRTLGLHPCFFLSLTGWICPSCGLTTSFTHLAHLQWGQALSAHPLGPALFFLLATLSLFSVLEFFGRNTPLRKFLNGGYTTWVYLSLFLYLSVWGIRLISAQAGIN